MIHGLKNKIIAMGKRRRRHRGAGDHGSESESERGRHGGSRRRRPGSCADIGGAETLTPTPLRLTRKNSMAPVLGPGRAHWQAVRPAGPDLLVAHTGTHSH